MRYCRIIISLGVLLWLAPSWAANDIQQGIHGMKWGSRISVHPELTKVHEEVFRGTVSQAMEQFAEPRGEFTLVIAGKQEKDKPRLTADIQRQLNDMRCSGAGAKEAVFRVAEETGLSKKELYQSWLRAAR